MTDNENMKPLKFIYNLQLPAAITTIILLLGGIGLSLTPYLIFHSRQYGIYDWYRVAGMFAGFGSLIPANVWLFSILWPRMIKPVAILLMVIITASAGFIIFWIFVIITFTTVDWFTF